MAHHMPQKKKKTPSDDCDLDKKKKCKKSVDVDKAIDDLHEYVEAIEDLHDRLDDLAGIDKARRRRRRRRVGFRPPSRVASNARQGLRIMRLHGIRGSNASVFRGRRLAARRTVTLRTLRAMKRFFDRFGGTQANETEPAGPAPDGTVRRANVRRILWLLNGGAAGRRWVNFVLDRVNRDPFFVRSTDDDARLMHATMIDLAWEIASSSVPSEK